MSAAPINLPEETDRYLASEALRRLNRPNDVGGIKAGALFDALCFQSVCKEGDQTRVSTPEFVCSDTDEMHRCLEKILVATIDYANKDLYTAMGLLVAIDRSQGLEYFRQKQACALALARALLLFIECYNDRDAHDIAAKPFVCNLLNAWLSPSIPWAELPAREDVASAMFGSAWVLFAGDERRLLFDLLAVNPPSFRLGLCQEQVLTSSADLPDLGFTA